MIRVGYLGPEGTYCHQALKQFMQKRGETFSEVPFRTISELFLGLDERVVGAAVVPLITSIDGSYSETAKGLLEYGVVQRGSLDLKIDLMIGIHPASSKEKISRIFSRGSALRECSRYLDEHFPNAARIESDSTAQGMKGIIDESLLDVAAVGGAFGMQRYGLTILDRHIEDQKDNFTTFLYLCKKER